MMRDMGSSYTRNTAFSVIDAYGSIKALLSRHNTHLRAWLPGGRPGGGPTLRHAAGRNGAASAGHARSRFMASLSVVNRACAELRDAVTDQYFSAAPDYATDIPPVNQVTMLYLGGTKGGLRGCVQGLSGLSHETVRSTLHTVAWVKGCCSSSRMVDRPLHTVRGRSMCAKGGVGKKDKLLRLDRVLSNRGVGSRTEVSTLIKRGRVRIEGETVRDPGRHVQSDAVVHVNDAPVGPLPLVVAYHKPLGVHSTIGDPQGRPNLEGVLPARYAKTFHPVGRLDADTTGLLLFSADGQLTQRLLHPTRGVEREYLATVEGDIDVEPLRQRLAAGVETTDGTFPATLTGCEGQVLRVRVTEGKYRMVRRVLFNADHPVVALHRLRYGAIDLGELEPGEYREVAGEEDLWAKSLLS